MILEKLGESIIGVEDLSKNVDSPDDAAELIKKIDKMIKSKKKTKF